MLHAMLVKASDHGASTGTCQRGSVVYSSLKAPH